MVVARFRCYYFVKRYMKLSSRRGERFVRKPMVGDFLGVGLSSMCVFSVCLYEHCGHTAMLLFLEAD